MATCRQPPTSLSLKPDSDADGPLDEAAPALLPAVPVADSERAPGPPSVGHLCGLWYWRPRWLQPLATIRVFIVCVCLFSCICSALNSGYVVSMISTIEKRFEIGSTLAGFMTSCYEIGYIPAVVLVSYLGGSRRKPVWIATGAVVMAIAALIFSLPQFIAPPYSATRLALGEQVRTCRGGNHSTLSTQSGTDPCHGLKGGYGGHSNTFNVFLIVLANVLLGCGASPILTLGTTFIDDHTSQEAAPPLIATIYASAAVGPMVGHLVGAVMLQYYVDQYVYDHQDLQALNMKPGHPEWVGAWWGGFILFGLLLAICSIPLYMFPAKLKRSLHPSQQQAISGAIEAPRSETERMRGEEVTDEAQLPLRGKTYEPPARVESGRQDEAEMTPGIESLRAFGDGEYGKHWRDLPHSILLLIRNRIYLVTCTGICFEMAVINAFGVFLPKYIETQFSVANFTASVLTGSCAVPAGALGIIAGGLLCRKLGLNRRGAVRVVLMANVAVLFLYFLSFIIGCENSDIAGLNADYSPNRTWSGEVSVQHSCNAGCGPGGGMCDELVRNPVCSLDLNLTYLSPCHAGCTLSNGSAYSNCSCLISAGMPPDAVVYKGPCEQQLRDGSCSERKMVPFLIFLCLTIFVTALTQNPLLMVTMRSVRPEERAFALGFQFVILRLFGYIPAPITFGRVIDSTCLHWLRLMECPAAASSSAATSSAAAAAAAAAAMSAAIPPSSSDAASSATGRLGGSCMFYNVVLFRNKVFGLALGLKFASLIVYIILWSLLKRDCLGAGESEENVGGGREVASVASGAASNASGGDHSQVRVTEEIALECRDSGGDHSTTDKALKV